MIIHVINFLYMIFLLPLPMICTHTPSPLSPRFTNKPTVFFHQYLSLLFYCTPLKTKRKIKMSNKTSYTVETTVSTGTAGISTCLDSLTLAPFPPLATFNPPDLLLMMKRTVRSITAPMRPSTTNRAMRPPTTKEERARERVR